MCRDDAALSLAAAQVHQAEEARRHEAELRRVRGAAQLISDELDQRRRRHPTTTTTTTATTTTTTTTTATTTPTTSPASP